jgi:hypothetical protein
MLCRNNDPSHLRQVFTGEGFKILHGGSCTPYYDHLTKSIPLRDVFIQLDKMEPIFANRSSLFMR